MKIKEAGKLYLDGKLKFYDLDTMKKVDWYFALENAEQCVAKLYSDWHRFRISDGLFGSGIRFTSY